MIWNDFVYAPGLDREVLLDIYQFNEQPKTLLLLNDGQEVRKMDLAGLLDNLQLPVAVVAIHAGSARLQEYGVASQPDYNGDGAKAGVYTTFITTVLLPALYNRFPDWKSLPVAFAGFSLGGLSALDIVWHHPEIFSFAGVCSGSLWWRNVPLGPDYSDANNRIMHKLIRESDYQPGLQFFFQCGTEDETADRNGNGIIDSIDDTRDLIQELLSKGYTMDKDIWYDEIAGGRHDSVTWEKALAAMLLLPFFNDPGRK
ncbi:putative esterase [Chitinophaga dinghuensis]|uniref:Putative esterase n=1 Tax=Chitinophaga dinghuensis TaxID=1539050 RepID=A0A327VHI2_9BACT|nr:alpha/beta hydrolase-fold protein [Chitinophaga dinghuensis]RAJ72836.1 putative esterase [Chitinophaga dinghuensis]